METMKRDSKRSRSGLVLPVIAAIAICLALLGLAVLKLGFGSRLMATRTMAGVSARAAADAGLTRALYEMNALFDPGLGWLSPLPPDVVDQPLGNSNATFSYQCNGPLLSYPATGVPYRVITSIGKLGSQEKTVYAVLGMRNLFDYALIVTDKLVLKAGTLIDGYNSAIGYPSAGVYPLKIGTNSVIPPPAGGIDLGTGSIVKGDVLVGQGGDPEYIIREGGGGAETGPRYSLPEPFVFREIKPPSVYHAPPVPLDGGTDLKIIAPPGYDDPNYPYTVQAVSSISIGQGGRLTVVGHVAVRVFGDMSFGQGAMLNVGYPEDDPSWVPPDDPAWVPSSLVIYLDGDLHGQNAGGINNTSRIPGYFKLFGTGEPYQQWDIKNSRVFYGVYYGPNVDIIIRADADVYGSVSGHSYEMKNSGNMHYDVRLAGESGYDVGFGIDRWWETSAFVTAGL